MIWCRAAMVTTSSMTVRAMTPYLIGEITSVGDEAFRDKSKAMLKDRLQTRGAMVVPYSAPLLKRMCNAAVVIEDGKVTWFD